MNKSELAKEAYNFILDLAVLIMTGKSDQERVARLRFNWASGVVHALYPPRVDLIKNIKPREYATFIERWKPENEDFHKRLSQYISELQGWPVLASQPAVDTAGSILEDVIVVEALTDNEKIRLELDNLYVEYSQAFPAPETDGLEITPESAIRYIEDMAAAIFGETTTSRDVLFYWESRFLKKAIRAKLIYDEPLHEKVTFFLNKYCITPDRVIPKLTQFVVELKGWPVRDGGKITVLGLTGTAKRLFFEHIRLESAGNRDRVTDCVKMISLLMPVEKIDAHELDTCYQRVNMLINETREADIEHYFGGVVLDAILAYKSALQKMHQLVNDRLSGVNPQLVRQYLIDVHGTMSKMIVTVLIQNSNDR